MNTWADFKEVKRRVTIEQALARYGVREILRDKGDELVGCCPIHKGTNPSQFHVSRQKNNFNCFGNCHDGGNVIDFVVMMEGWNKDSMDDQRKAALLLQDWFGIESQRPSRLVSAPRSSGAPAAGVAAEKELTTALPPAIDQKVNVPLKFTLKSLDSEHPYLHERGLTTETIGAFGIGYFGGKGIMHGRIAIPIHDQTGQLVAYVGRWPGDDDPPEGEGKYKLPPGFHKSLVVFNLHRAIEHAKEKGLIVVEGFFDAMRVHQAGYPNVVALMGSSMSDEQERFIVEAVGAQGKVALMLDEDEAGWKCRKEAIERLVGRVYVKVVALGQEGRQPDQMSEEDFRTRLA